MAQTAPATKQRSGKVVQVIGPVIDIVFPEGLPAIYNAVRVVSEGVNELRSPDRAILLITHYQRLLNYIVPDKVHVMAGGAIAKSGGKELALQLEKSGYAEFKAKAPAHA